MSIIYIIILWFIIKKFIIPRVKNANGIKDTTNSAAFRRARQEHNTFLPNNTYYTQKRVSHKERDVDLLKMEDRHSDWLAKQLRCEQQAQIVVSDMFQLRQEHSNHCDADLIREEHSRSCQQEQTYQGTTKMSQTEMDALKERIKQRNN